jgi:hypothetical protein
MSATYELVDDAPRVAARPRVSLRELTALKPQPMPVVASTWFRVPDRVFRDPSISKAARMTAVALCSIARNGEVALDVANDTIIEHSGLGSRGVDTSLSELENAGLICRLSRLDGRDVRRRGVANLEAIGYSCPWTAAGKKLPIRVIVLLWRLPTVHAAPAAAERT